MKKKKQTVADLGALFVSSAVVIVLLACITTPAIAADSNEAQGIVDRARVTFIVSCATRIIPGFTSTSRKQRAY